MSLGINLDIVNNITVIHLSGYLNANSSQMIEEVLNNQIEKNTEVIAVDFGGIEQMDSYSIHLLVKYVQIARVKNIDFRFINMDHQLDLLRKENVDSYFSMTTLRDLEKEKKNRGQKKKKLLAGKFDLLFDLNPFEN